MIIKLDQQSKEWHEFRKEGIGSSDIGIIMGLNPWKTREQLLQDKVNTEIVWQPPNKYMQRGLFLEPIARHIYEKKFCQAQPAVMIHDTHSHLRASLDGYNNSNQIALEIKCPGQKDHLEARYGRVPEKYKAQVQHLLMVSNAKRLHYFSYDGNTTYLVEVFNDPLFQEQMFNAGKDFWTEVLDYRKNGLPKWEGKKRSVRRTG